MNGVPVEDVMTRIPKGKFVRSRGGRKAEYETDVIKLPDSYTAAVDALIDAYFIPESKVKVPVKTWVLENKPVTRPEYISHSGETDLIPTSGFDIRNGYVLVETDESYYSTLYFIDGSSMAKRIISLNPLQTQNLQVALSTASDDLERQEIFSLVATEVERQTCNL